MHKSVGRNAGNAFDMTTCAHYTGRGSLGLRGFLGILDLKGRGIYGEEEARKLVGRPMLGLCSL